MSPADAVWRRERRGRSVVYGPVYRSGFLSAFLAGTLEDGQELAVATGTHARHYPYFHPRSKWDDLLLAAGDRRMVVARRRVSTLSIALGPGRSGTLGFHGLAQAADAAVDVHLHVELDATVYHPRAEGIGIRHPVLGLQWQPARVSGSGSLTLDGRRRRIARVAGLMERGTLTNLRGPLFEFAFEYTAVARPGEPCVYVRFRTRPMRGGLAGLPLRALLAGGAAREELTLEGRRPRRGDRHGLAPAPGERQETLVTSRVDVGPATLSRQLIRIGEDEARRYGLRQAVETTS